MSIGNKALDNTNTISIPSADSSDNTHIEDVVGNKTDTVAGDSLIGLNKLGNSYGIKIDSQAVSGLTGTANSLAYKVNEIENHFHSREKWLGAAAAASGETHVADRVIGTTTAFTLTAGDNTFGSWVQILGSSDTPIVAGNVYFDPHSYLVTTTNSTNPYIIQIAQGESSDLATKIANEQFTDIMYISASNNNDSGIYNVLSPRVAVGQKLWARAACIGSNGTTISFYFAVHEYEG